MRTSSPLSAITRLMQHPIRIERVVEAHDVAGPRRAELVHEAVDQQAVVVFERGLHAETHDARYPDAECRNQRQTHAR